MDKDAQRNPESVRRFWGRVATGDWDAVIVPESRFSQLHVSKERRLRNMRARVDEFAHAVKAAAKARGDARTRPSNGWRRRAKAPRPP